jgi:hypothetical protein
MTIPVPVCFFDEMNLYHHSGSVKKFISSDGVVNYDKDRIISYLSKPLKKAGCPRAGLDCVTGKEISMSFQLFSDEKYTWGDFLIYHIQHYPIILPDDFVQHIMDKTYRSQ